MSLLIEAYELLPQLRDGDDPDLFQAGLDAAVSEFRLAVEERYTEGTLARILSNHLDATSRRAAAVGLGLVGTMASNSAVAGALHDPDDDVRNTAAQVIWELWFRGDAGPQALELRQALGLNDTGERVGALTEILREFPEYAEAYNQRAIQLFGRGELRKCINDCENALRLNPFHFGAAAGIGQCYLRMKKPRSALRSFTHALKINPDLDSLKDVLDSLRDTLGGE